MGWFFRGRVVLLLLLRGRVVGRVWVHWWFGARAEDEAAYHCEGDVLVCLNVGCVLWCSRGSRSSSGV